jgi:hypothetical protein
MLSKATEISLVAQSETIAGRDTLRRELVILVREKPGKGLGRCYEVMRALLRNMKPRSTMKTIQGHVEDQTRLGGRRWFLSRSCRAKSLALLYGVGRYDWLYDLLQVVESRHTLKAQEGFC